MKQGVPIEFTDADRARIREALARGVKQREIAGFFGCDASRIRREIVEHGLAVERATVCKRGENAKCAAWSEAAVAILNQMWNDGKSAEQIARALTTRLDRKISRNAVIGKAHRLGLTQTTRQPPSPPGMRAEGLGAAGTRGKANNPRGKRSHGPPPAGDFGKSDKAAPGFREPPIRALAAPRLAAVADDFLAAGQQPVGCRYVEGAVSASVSDDPQADGWRYCQRQPRAGSSFCPAHHAACKTAGDDLKDFALAMGAAPVNEIIAAIEQKFGVDVSRSTIRGWRSSATRKEARAA